MRSASLIAGRSTGRKVNSQQIHKSVSKVLSIVPIIHFSYDQQKVLDIFKVHHNLFEYDQQNPELIQPESVRKSTGK